METRIETARDEVTNKVRAQYERFPYPQPIDKIEDELLSGIAGLEASPIRDFHLYWPAAPFRDDLDVLIAGCGSSQAAAMAATMPRARIVGIDISTESLERSAALAARHGLTNVEHRQMSLYDVVQLGQNFDVIQAAGVLHHLADPAGGLRALRDVLKPDGSLFIMVYGRYGRDGVYLLQDLYRRLGVSPENVSPAQLASMRELLSELPATHPIRFRREQCNLFTVENDAELVDLYLHPQDVAYTVPDVYALLRDGGCMMQRWYNNAEYSPRFTALLTSAFGERIMAMPREEQFAIGELARSGPSRHAFIACRDDRPIDSAMPPLEGDAFWASIPLVRWVVNRNPREDGEPGLLVTVSGHAAKELRFNLSPAQADILGRLDNRRSVRDIADGLAGLGSPEVIDGFVESFIKDMVEADVVALRVAHSSREGN